MYVGKKGITIAPLTYSGKVLQKDGKVVTKQHIVPARIIGCRFYVFDTNKVPIAALDFDNGTVIASGYSYKDLEVSEYVMTYYLEEIGEYKSNDEINNKVTVYTCSENVELFKFLVNMYKHQFILCRYRNESAHEFIMYSAGLSAQILGYLTTKFKDVRTVHDYILNGSKGLESEFRIDVENLGFYCEIFYDSSLTNNDMSIRVVGTKTIPSAVELVITLKDILRIKGVDASKLVKRICAYILATPDFVYTLSPLVLNPGKYNKNAVSVRGLVFNCTDSGYSNTSHVGDTTITMDVHAR